MNEPGFIRQLRQRAGRQDKLAPATRGRDGALAPRLPLPSAAGRLWSSRSRLARCKPEMRPRACGLREPATCARPTAVVVRRRRRRRRRRWGPVCLAEPGAGRAVSIFEKASRWRERGASLLTESAKRLAGQAQRLARISARPAETVSARAQWGRNDVCARERCERLCVC